MDRLEEILCLTLFILHTPRGNHLYLLHAGLRCFQQMRPLWKRPAGITAKHLMTKIHHTVP